MYCVPDGYGISKKNIALFLCHVGKYCKVDGKELVRLPKYFQSEIATVWTASGFRNTAWKNQESEYNQISLSLGFRLGKKKNSVPLAKNGRDRAMKLSEQKVITAFLHTWPLMENSRQKILWFSTFNNLNHTFSYLFRFESTPSKSTCNFSKPQINSSKSGAAASIMALHALSRWGLKWGLFSLSIPAKSVDNDCACFSAFSAVLIFLF